MTQYAFAGIAPWGHGRQERLLCTAADERIARLALRAHYPGWTVSEQAIERREANPLPGGLDATSLGAADLAYLEKLAGDQPPSTADENGSKAAIRGGGVVPGDDRTGRRSWGRQDK